MEQKFFKCEHCGNIITMVEDKGVPVMCCGQKMTELVPGTVDAAVEKHIPVYEVKDGIVEISVGEVEHPMVEAHYIEWVAVQTDKGIYRKHLAPEQAPKTCIAVCDDEKIEAVYAYCNLHGLWKK